MKKMNFLPRRKKIGALPGSMIFLGEQKSEQVRIELISYDVDHISTSALPSLNDVETLLQTPSINWINVIGLHDSKVMEQAGKIFSLHPLVLEDMLNTDQRPKLEIYDDYVFIVLKMLSYDRTRGILDSEQVSLIFGTNYVLMFQEKEGDVFNPLRDRLNKNKGRLRRSGGDYLAYSIIDMIIDNYFLVLEVMAEAIEEMETDAMSPSGDRVAGDIHHLKRELIYLRKAVWPLREVISQMQREATPLICETTQPYVRDLYDHTIQIIDTIETYRDTVSGLLDIHLSAISNRMNEVMKTLTIISTIFIPLNFIAGIYGMNFVNMPELKTTWGYPVVWCVFITVALTMLYYFRRKKWL